MEMPIMYHPPIPTPTLPTPSMPSWLRRAYINTAPRSAPNTLPTGGRPVTPSGVPGPGAPAAVEPFRRPAYPVRQIGTTEPYRPAPRPTVVSGEPGLGSPAIGVEYAPGEGGVVIQGPPGAPTVTFPNPWGWGSGRVPRNAQEREEKAAYDGAFSETTRALPGADPNEVRALLGDFEQVAGSSDNTNAQNAQIQGVIDALRAWLQRRGLPAVGAQPPAPAPTPVEAPTTPAPVVPTFTPGQLGHTLGWPGVHAAAGDDNKIVAFVRKLKGGTVPAGFLFDLLQFGRAVWNAKAAGDVFAADDLLNDAIANSDPKFADTLRQIADFADQALPENQPAAGFANRPRR